MTLVKTSLFNGIAAVVKVATALVLNKLLATYVGPAGYAVIGQFQNAVSILVNLSAGFLTTGVTKGTAQHFDAHSTQHAVWQTAVRLGVGASIAIGLVLALASDGLAGFMLDRADMGGVFICLGIALPAIALNNLLLAIVNGKKEIRVYVVANIAGSFISLVVTGALASSFGLYGALVAFAINPALVLIATAAMVTRLEWFRFKDIFGGIEQRALRELFGFAIMGITSAVALPLTQMLIRDHIGSTLGTNAAGYWQASWKISEIYLMLVTTTLSVYYLPRLAEIRGGAELRSEIIKVYRLVLPIVTLGAAVMYVLRDWIIAVLFTPDFNPMRELFMWQLIGDVLKIGSWVIAYVMLGRAMVRTFVVTEIAFAALFYVASVVFIKLYGIEGVPIAYALTYLIYWAAMVVLLRGQLRAD